MSNSEELIQEYIQNGLEIAEIAKQTQIKQKQAMDARDKIRIKITNIRSQIEEQALDLERNSKLILDSITAEEQNQIDLYQQQRLAVKRIIQFLDVHKTPLPIEIGEVTFRKGEFAEWRDWIYDNDYLKIRLLLHENDKPVNKYSLMVYGVCAFKNPLVQLPQYYRSHLHIIHMDIFQELKSFKTIGAAIVYIDKNKKTLFHDLIAAVEALTDEYLTIIKKYSLSDFEELFEYTCLDCRTTFKTIPDSHNIELPGLNSREFKKCPCHYGFHRKYIY